MVRFIKVDKGWAFGLALDLQGLDTHLHIFLGPVELEIGGPHATT